MPDYPPGWVVDEPGSVWIPAEDFRDVRQAFVNDEFLTPEYPVVSPRTCEPGPGILEIFSNQLGGGSDCSVGCDERLDLKSPSPAGWGDFYIYTSNSLERSNNLNLYCNTLCWGAACAPAFGWAATQSSSFTGVDGDGLYLNAGRFYVLDSAGATADRCVGLYSYNLNYDVVAQLRSPSGCVFAVRGNEFTNWTLLFVSSAGSNTPLYPHYWMFLHDGYLKNFEASLSTQVNPLTYDDFNRPDIGNIGIACGADDQWQFTGTWNIVNQRLVGTATNTSVAWLESNVADGLLVTTIKVPAGGVAEVILRRKDASNYISVSVSINTQLFAINEYISGSPTPIASSNPTAIVADTDLEIQVVMDGTTISAYLNGRNGLNTPIGAITPVTNTDGTQHGVGKNTVANIEFDDFYLWPRTLES